MTETITGTSAGIDYTVKTGEPTPAERLKASSRAEVRVTDEQGRTFVLRKPNALAQFDLIDGLGDSARNETFVGMCLPLLFVASIDGDIVPPPATRAEINALIGRLGDEGIQAVMEGVRANFAAGNEATVKNG